MTLVAVRYDIEDSGTRVWFESPDPGAGQPTDYSVLLTDGEVTAAVTQAQLTALCQGKLERLLRGTTASPKLDPFIGTRLTVDRTRAVAPAARVVSLSQVMQRFFG